MFTATIQSLSGARYQILDTVWVSYSGLAGISRSMKRAMTDVQNRAQRMGADGVIGVQVSTAVGNVLWLFPVYTVTVTGTAIKVLDPVAEEPGQVSLPHVAIPSRAPLVPARSPTPPMPQPGYYPPTAPFFSPEAPPHSEPSWRR
jgi:hypothetical protein